ncbi:hypothetical protein ACFWM0_23295 [Streptomyces sp. NPDC058405]|uniref:hypothetical protein n=1 Tax=unclassified Streptomyces TaxID=2593676 RepID=UPI0036679958
MPIDPFAALNAMLRAEVARADVSEARRRASRGSDRDAEPVAASDGAAADGERTESGSPQ